MQSREEKQVNTSAAIFVEALVSSSASLLNTHTRTDSRHPRRLSCAMAPASNAVAPHPTAAPRSSGTTTPQRARWADLFDDDAEDPWCAPSSVCGSTADDTTADGSGSEATTDGTGSEGAGSGGVPARCMAPGRTKMGRAGGDAADWWSVGGGVWERCGGHLC